MDLGAALLAIVTGFLVKGAVMVLAGWLVVRVYGATSAHPPRRLWLLVPDEERDRARILFWALLCFAVSELTCGVEIYVLSRSSAVLEGFHSVVSALGMALFALGLFRVLDRRFFRFTANDCLARRLCGTCTVRTDAGCKVRLSLLLLASSVVLASLLPLLAPTDRMTADLHRFALPLPALNAWYDRAVVPWLSAHVPGFDPSGQAFFFPSSVFVLEYRVIPLVAGALAVAAIVSLATHRLVRGVELLSLSVGALGYTYFELALYRGTGDLMLGSLGHEVFELWFLLFTVEVLRYVMPTTAPRVREREIAAE